MRSGGFVVRFVDVVLILLFGFISISSIRETEIDLPESTETPPAPSELYEPIYVAIRSDGAYLVDEERQELRGGAMLHQFLSDRLMALRSADAKVYIRASRDAPMRYLIEAARVCDALGVPKAFEVLMVGPQE
jgi:biopolymer transport protein ExbD